MVPERKFTAISSSRETAFPAAVSRGKRTKTAPDRLSDAAVARRLPKRRPGMQYAKRSRCGNDLQERLQSAPGNLRHREQSSRRSATNFRSAAGADCLSRARQSRYALLEVGFSSNSTHATADRHYRLSGRAGHTSLGRTGSTCALARCASREQCARCAG